MLIFQFFTIQKKYFLVTFIGVICLIFACNPTSEGTNTSKNKTQDVSAKTGEANKDTTENESVGYPPQKYVTLASGKKIPRSEKGITIVNEDGWEASQMEFQQSYCEQTVANLEAIDGPKFCACFLEKVQYYYEPIYIKDAYADQERWNQECYQEATK